MTIISTFGLPSNSHFRSNKHAKGSFARRRQLSALDRAHEQREEVIYAHQETFGIAGAIYKRWWQVDTQVRHLVKAQELYEKGWRLAQGWSAPGIPDQGYTGINAAFVLDLLAQQVPDDLELVAQRKQKAQQIRAEIRARLTALPESKRNDWWTLVTLAEACFGLRDYDGARCWLKAVAAITPPQPWEYETTVKQLAKLAMIQAGGDKAVEEFARSDAWSVLSEFVGGDQAGLLTAFSGKVGLALSGGGFRASLFHIGVLARLAELDMLRHVEVLSCVSGGSIIGALYYLKVRALLESKPDNEITREDYLKLVHDMDEEFTAMIQHNPRMQVFSKLAQFGQRTEEMGKLLDTTLYGPAAGLKYGDRPELRSLKIYPPLTSGELRLPREQRSPFIPKYDNWQRGHKVPILIINATTLNTGHNWQFTATFMGESPNQITPEVDGNERLRRMYFDEKMPDEHRKLPLGLAVAASAAVPGLFRPVQLAGLYKDRDIQLADGGVHDNQGIGGLLEQDCTVILVSDASGQFVTERQPSRFETSVLLRSNSTLMARVRELEYRELTARKEASLLRDFLFVHLKKDLAVDPVDWLDCDLTKESPESEGIPPESDKPTRYGVRADVQNLLAGIRTDLDVFSEAEAYALMASGYLMTAHYFPRNIKSFNPTAATDPRWRFLKVNRFLSDPAKRNTDAPEPCQVTDFLAALNLAAQLLFKGLRLVPNPRLLKCLVWATVVIMILVSVFVVAAAFAGLLWRMPLLLLPLAFWFVAVSGVGLVLARGALYPVARYFDDFYIEKGSLKNLLRPTSPRTSR
jgi:predicted acylesterase/phospholipase RssA